ncbi:MAG: DegT/DnrJ/EryC1/StrS family aminotransferase [Firmicutes bacterium]|nr:DegT/DnrJ/EryC1/StrS family aminotransferase [Bacillota bacterium]
MQIKFSPPDITNLEAEAACAALKSGWITTGPKTKLFEQQIARYCGVSRAAALNSATACLELTLRVLGIGPGDEVITSAYTYTASASVIHHVGAKIVLVDTAPDSYFISPDALEKAITKKTKAVIPVDIGGVLADYAAINKIVEAKRSIFTAANRYQEALGRIAVIADAAHSFGSEFQSIRAGALADFTCFSFHAVKNLTTAEGGAVVWKALPNISCDEIYREFMLYSLHGQDKDALAKSRAGAWEYDIVRLGYKCNMTDILASVGLVQLERYPNLLNQRKKIIVQYGNAFKNKRVSVLEHYSPHRQSSGHLYLTRVNGIFQEQRNAIIEQMAEAGVACNVHYKPLPMHTAYKKLGFNIVQFPNSYAQYQNEITLPLYSTLSEKEVDYIAESYIKIINSIS